MYCLCSKNKGADQLRGYRTADLRLCLCIYKKPVFSRRSSYCKKILCAGVYIIFLFFALKHRLLVLVRTSMRQFYQTCTHSPCFKQKKRNLMKIVIFTAIKIPVHVYCMGLMKCQHKGSFNYDQTLNTLGFPWHNMSLVVRKPVFRVSHQVRHKP